jgi:two-component sensor histidine kinase
LIEDEANQDRADKDHGLAEQRHRLANLFQLLSTLTRMRQQRSVEPEARRQLGWILEAVSALGALQQRMVAVDGCDFAGFLTDMQAQWRRRIGGRPVQLHVETDPLVLREQLASAVAIIANELVTNAINHAHPADRAGVIKVTLTTEPGGRAALTISDDGVGRDDLTEDRTKLGLWLIKGLADQVRGEMTSNLSAGVTTRLEFPAS